MSYQRRLSYRLIEGFQSACEAQNEILATVLREAANVELAGVHRRTILIIDRIVRPFAEPSRNMLTCSTLYPNTLAYCGFTRLAV